MSTKKNKATPEASIGQRVSVARITGEDNRGKFLSAEDAERIISDHVFERDKKSLMRGRVVRSTFLAQAKRLYEWAKADKKAPEVVAVKVGRGWEFRPAGAAKGGFPA
ncbi:MAG: hypothetical protein MZV49_24145 [Rhodopseudomonas palustris]|nr:hypothetical protein [Rhodopseudomonas palustris]